MLDIGPEHHLPEPAFSRLLIEHTAIVQYYTDEPSPSQWVAIGMVLPLARLAAWGEERRLLVGCGRSEAAAIEDLAFRLAELLPAADPPPEMPPGDDAPRPAR